MPYDGETPSWAALMRRAADERVGQMHTAIPGRVVKYDAATQKAWVQPVVKGISPVDGSSVKMPQLPSMPVVFPQGGGFSITWPLKPGDTVLVIFSEQAMAQWLISGNDDAEPEHPWRFELTDGIVLAGMRPFVGSLTSPSDTEMKLGLEDETAQIVINVDGGVVVKSDDVRLGSAAASDFVALSSLVAAELVKIQTAISGVGGVYTPGAVAAAQVKAQ